MNELMYSFRESNVRVVKVDGEPWFVAKDVCDILEISKHRDAIVRLEEYQRGSVVMDTLGGKQNMSAINESGLYSLIFTSRKTEAKEFQKWITSEVLPSIRKNGIYATEDTLDHMLNNPQYMIDVLAKLKDESDKRKAAEKTVNILSHVNKNYTATEIAKECGLTSANRLNKILNEKGVQYYQNGTWILYSKYSPLGYVDIKQEVLDTGKVVYHRRFTQMGREFVLKLLS